MENTTYEADGGTLVLNISTITTPDEMHTTDVQQSMHTHPPFTTVVTEEWFTFELGNFSNDFNDRNWTVEAAGSLSLSTVHIFIAALSAVLSFITILGNLLVLYAFCAERRLRTYTNYYIVGLSISDLVAGVFTMPMYSIYWVLGYWPLGNALCDIYLYLNHVFIHVSVLAILVLAIDRYQAVSQPLKHLQRRTLRHASFMIGIAYIVPFIIWLPYTILWPYIAGTPKTAGDTTCIPFYVKESVVFSILASVIFFWIPLPITSVLYWRIYIVIRSTKTQRRGPVMMQELSTSTSRVTVADGIPSNVSGKVESGSPQQHINDIANVHIVVDNANNHQELGQENRAFDLDEEEQYGNMKNNKMANSAPNISNLHSHRNQLPILDPNIQGKRPNSNGAAQQKQTMTTTKKDRESKKENNRATHTLTLIFIVLMVSSVPWSILVIIRCLCPTCVPLVLYQTSVYLGHMNSTVNPLCYAIANPLYMDAFLKLVCCGRRTRRRARDSRPSTRRTR